MNDTGAGVVGTPDDLGDFIDHLIEMSDGGFGTLLIQAHEWANPGRDQALATSSSPRPHGPLPAVRGPPAESTMGGGEPRQEIGAARRRHHGGVPEARRGEGGQGRRRCRRSRAIPSPLVDRGHRSQHPGATFGCRPGRRGVPRRPPSARRPTRYRGRMDDTELGETLLASMPRGHGRARRAFTLHAKGIGAAGWLPRAGTPARSRPPVTWGKTGVHPVQVRFSNGTGTPDQPDTGATVGPV